MAYVPTPDIIIEHDGPVAIITLNQPEQRNAFSDSMHDGMQEIWTHLAKDRSVKAIVLTGAGKAFSAGGNIPGFIRSYEDPIHRAESMRGAQRLLDAMLECPIPMVSAVNGPAVGLGCSVATSCDVVLIAESTFMADTHVPIGLVAGDGGAVQWPVLMGMLQAKYYLLTGDRIPAAKCVELGLATFAVPDDQLMTEALRIANRLAAQPMQAIQETKRALNLHIQQAVRLVSPFANAAEEASFSTDDIRKTIEGFKK